MTTPELRASFEGENYVSEHKPITVEQAKKRLAALMDYEMSVFRINEQSDAADREFDRILIAKSRLQQFIRDNKKPQP